MSDALDAMEARLAGTMFNISSVGMAQIDALTRRFLRVNPALCTLTGYAEAELLRMTVGELNHPEDRAADGLAFERLLRGEALYRVEKRYLRKDGGVVWVRATGDVLRDAAGRPLRCCGVIEDISERKCGEQRLRESEARLALMFERAQVGLSEIAADGRFLRVNPELGRIVGRDPGALLRLGIADVTAAEDVPHSLAVAGRVLAQGGNATVEKHYRRPDGSRVVAQSSLTRLEAPDGGAPRLLAVTVDLTARRRAEAALRESEARLRAIANLVPDLLWSTDAAGHADWFNRRWCEYTGQTEAQALGSGWADVVHPDDQALAVARWREALERRQPLDNEVRLRDRDGRYRWHLVRAEPQLDEDGRVLRWFGSTTDAHDVHGAREVLEQRVDERTRELRALLARVEHVQDEERRRIARELHDSLGQYLSSLALAVGTVTQQQRDPEDRERLRRLQPLMQQVDRELDRIVFTLRPTALEDCGLGDGVAAYVATWSELSSTPVDLEQHGLDGERLPAPVEAAVFRVIQEALNNVSKHAGASRVSVTLKRSRRHLQASVEDDGVGFEAAEGRDAAAGRLGWGVLGMKERIEALGGQFAVESQPGTGTTVLLRVPLRESPAAAR